MQRAPEIQTKELDGYFAEESVRLFDRRNSENHLAADSKLLSNSRRVKFQDEHP